MRRFFNFSFGFFIFLLSLFFLLTSCENPLFVEATKLYEVTFETNGGSRIESYHTERIEKSPETEKAGFTFDGWYRNSSLTTKIESFPLKIESNMTLYAKWKQNYRVTFVTNGGSAINETNSMDVCILDSAPLTNRDGFEVTAWYLNAGFSGSPVSFPYQVTSPVTMYAKWAPVFMLNFVTNGGSIISPKKTTSLKVAPLSERAGFTLVGWYADEELTESVSFPLELSQSMTLYARWERNFTVNFESNGGTAFENLSTWCVEQRPEPIKSGLSFGGWYTSSDFAPSTKVAFPFYPNKNTTLYARWNYYNYIVTYELNGGYNHSENPDGFDKENNAIPLHEPSRAGCEFLGWYEDAKFTGSAITEISANAGEDKTYYAKWKPILYAIEYVLNGGKLETANPTSYTVETETFLLNSPSKTGYTFGGWCEKADFSGQARKEIEKGSVGNKKLYAKWTPTEYAITYNLNGGKNNGANPASYTIETANFTLSDASRNGYSFAGWYENANCTGTRITQIAKGSCGVKTLYAKWTLITYSIEYILNGGKFAMENPTSYTVERDTFTLKAPAKIGYNFGGWYEDANFNGNSLSQISKGSFGNKVLYAKWTTESYTITYELNGGVMPANCTSTFNSETSTFTLPEPSKNGFKFEGWYLTDNFSDEIITTIRQGTVGNITIYAKWGTLPVYSITYNLDGGNLTGDYATSFTENSPNIFLPSPKKVNYKFMGWFENQSFSGDDVIYIPTGTRGNKVLYAKWESSLPQQNTYYVTNYKLSSFNFENEKTEYTIVVSGEFSDTDFAVLRNKIEANDVQVNVDLCNVMNLTSIADELFDNLSNLKTVVLPSSVSVIGKFAFRNCINLEAINIPESVTTIKEGAFVSCRNLKSMIIPNSVTLLGDWAFSGCESLSSVILSENIQKLSGTFHYCLSLSEIILPKNLIEIGASTLYATSITEIIIPETVTSIGANAFGCTKLSSLIIPRNVKKIDGMYVYGCTSLKFIGMEERSQWYGSYRGQGQEIMDYGYLTSPEKITGYYGWCYYQWYRKD